MLGSVMAFSLVAPSTAQLVTALGSPELSTWIVGSWSLAAAASFTLAGTLSDVFGRRPVVLGGEILTVVGGIVGATAHTMPGKLTSPLFLLDPSFPTLSALYSLYCGASLIGLSDRRLLGWLCWYCGDSAKQIQRYWVRQE